MYMVQYIYYTSCDGVNEFSWTAGTLHLELVQGTLCPITIYCSRLLAYGQIKIQKRGVACYGRDHPRNGKDLGTCYSAAYTSRLEQQHFTISEMAAA